MLYYFASQDMMVSHTLARHFFWSEYILWKDDIPHLPLSVTLSGKDLIVPKEQVWKYLTDRDIHSIRSQNQSEMVSNAKQVEQGLLRVMWFDDFDHAGLFASKGACRGIARTIVEYSKEATSGGELA